MQILKFLNRKKKRILYFLIGMFFSFVVIFNNFIVVRADDTLSVDDITKISTDFYGDQNFSSSTNNLNQFCCISKDANLNAVHQTFTNSVLNGGSISFLDRVNFVCPFLKNNDYIFYNFVGENLTFNNIVCGGATDSYLYFGSSENFTVYSYYTNNNGLVSSSSLDISSATYNSEKNIYYFKVDIYGLVDIIPNFYCSNINFNNNENTCFNNIVNFLNGDFDNIKNKDFVDGFKSNINNYYKDSPYYNGYLKNFNVDWLPVIPESTSIYEVNEIGFTENNIRLSYDPTQTQANNIDKYLINARYTYGLQLKFYGYNMDSVRAYCDGASVSEFVNEVNPDLALKYALAYNNSLDQYIRFLNNAGFTVIQSNVTWQFIEYTARLNFSTIKQYKVQPSGVNLISSYSVFDSYYNNVLNALTTNICGISNPHAVDSHFPNRNMTGEEVSDIIRDSPYLDDHTFDIVAYVSGSDGKLDTVDVGEISMNGFGTATGLIGQVFLVDDSLQCEYVMNTNKSSKYTCKFNFINGTKEIIDNTISTKPTNDPNINDKNEVINSGDSFNSNVVSGAGGGSGGSGGSSSSSSNSSGGNASATSNSGGNTQNVTVQNGLDWNTKPITGNNNITVGSSINTGLSTITSMLGTNGFVPIISTWFSFVPVPFWNLLTTVFTICILLLVFKFFLWII